MRIAGSEHYIDGMRNPAVAFAIGLPLAYVLQRGWLKI